MDFAGESIIHSIPFLPATLCFLMLICAGWRVWSTAALCLTLYGSMDFAERRTEQIDFERQIEEKGDDLCNRAANGR